MANSHNQPRALVATFVMLLARARRSTLVSSTRLARHLGSWEAQFVAARGAPLEARQALSAKVEGDWVLERDDKEAAALAAEAGASADNQVTFVLKVQETRVAILRASMLNGTTGLLVGTQCDPALTLSKTSPTLYGRPARPNRLIGRSWPKLLAAPGVTWR